MGEEGPNFALLGVEREGLEGEIYLLSRENRRFVKPAGNRKIRDSVKGQTTKKVKRSIDLACIILRKEGNRGKKRYPWRTHLEREKKKGVCQRSTKKGCESKDTLVMHQNRKGGKRSKDWRGKGIGGQTPRQEKKRGSIYWEKTVHKTQQAAKWEKRKPTALSKERKRGGSRRFFR